MKKGMLKKIFCVMVSSFLIGQSGLAVEPQQKSTKDKVVAAVSKAAPFVCAGLPLVAAAIIIPIAMKHKDKTDNAKKADDNKDSKNTHSAANVVTKKMIDDSISNGKLPGIEVFYSKKGGNIVEYGYVCKDKNLARIFLMNECRLTSVAVDIILRCDHENVFFRYNDNPKINIMASYNLFWAYLKEAIGRLYEIKEHGIREPIIPVDSSDEVKTVLEAKKDGGVKPEVKPNASGAIALTSGEDKTSEQNTESTSKIEEVKWKALNEDIVKKINEVKAMGKSGTQYERLYEDLKQYGSGNLVGNTEDLKQGIDSAVRDGIIPGLALLYYVDLNVVGFDISIWHGYKIIDEEVFKGYLRYRLHCGIDEATQVLSLFKSREQKLFLYNYDQGYITGACSKIVRFAVGVVRWWNSSENVQNESVFVDKEFLEGDIFGIFKNDFSKIRRMGDGEGKKFNGTIDFSNFEKQPINPEEINEFKKFLEYCRCLES